MKTCKACGDPVPEDFKVVNTDLIEVKIRPKAHCQVCWEELFLGRLVRVRSRLAPCGTGTVYRQQVKRIS